MYHSSYPTLLLLRMTPWTNLLAKVLDEAASYSLYKLLTSGLGPLGAAVLLPLTTLTPLVHSKSVFGLVDPTLNSKDKSRSSSLLACLQYFLTPPQRLSWKNLSLDPVWGDLDVAEEDDDEPSLE